MQYAFSELISFDQNYLVMYENHVSMRMKQENSLKTKTQGFQTNYKQSFNRVKLSSSMHKLAGSVYSSKQNKLMSPKKSINRANSVSKIILDNPQDNTHAIKGLNMRASHISNYSDINTGLILERKSLEEKTAFLKDQIAKQKRLFSKANINCKKLENQLQKSENSIKELSVKSERLNNGITQAKQDCWNLNNNLNDLRSQNHQRNQEIMKQKYNCNNLDERCKLLKNHLLMEDKARTNTKYELIKSQIVMNSSSILMKQREQQRAVLLLQINKSVTENIFH